MSHIKNNKNALEIFPELDHMRLSLAKRYFYSFYSISVNLYKYIGNHARTQGAVLSCYLKTTGHKYGLYFFLI